MEEHEHRILNRKMQRQLMRERSEEVRRKTNEKTHMQKEKLRRSGIVRDVFYAVAMCFVLAAAFLLFYFNYPYTTYTVKSELALPGLSSAALYRLGNGALVVSRDGLTYIEDDEEKWTAALNMDRPVVKVKGGYFSIRDRDGYEIRIGDTTGLQSSVMVSRKVYDSDISSAGVTAVLTESDDAAYISYFDKFGSRLSVEVKAVLGASGYPLSIAVSPDGQRLGVVYYSTANGIGESRFVLYDFQSGRKEDSYVAYAKEDFYDTDSMACSCCFMDDSHVVITCDNELAFVRYTGGQASCTEEKLTDTVLSVFQSEKYYGAVMYEEEKPVCRVYDAGGSRVSSFECPGTYDKIVAGDSSLLFVNGSEITYYNITGKKRYSGNLADPPVSVLGLGPRTYLVNTGTLLQKIRLK